VAVRMPRPFRIRSEEMCAVLYPTPLINTRLRKAITS
jgi:hypothetical protein